MDFGSRLKLLRTNAGLTQAQLGNLVGVTKSVISYYELQERSPSPDVLIKLSQIFHVSTDELLGVSKGESVDVTGLKQEDVLLIRSLVERLRNKTE
ncbi:MAG: helix-turn-helix transcriptional regulator [Clostridia bacterium]|nr:helix-turn-helix transcriptional regulator [Clostridia bacterium]